MSRQISVRPLAGRGRPLAGAGSATPLMWAHGEYIKLPRSAAEGEVFDLIPIVAQRYLSRRGRKALEVWKPVRQVRRVKRGQVLRIQAPAAFRLHWTDGEWNNFRDTNSKSSGLGIYCVDIPVAKDQVSPVRFTFFWDGRGQWKGRDYEVKVI